MEGGTKTGVALMQAPLQKLGGCAVLREGHGVGAVGRGSAVGIVGGGVWERVGHHVRDVYGGSERIGRCIIKYIGSDGSRWWRGGQFVT